jgi:hypothetical protein
MNHQKKVVFACDVQKKRKIKSPFSELVVDGPLSNREFNAKLAAYREARAKKNGGK